MSTRKELRKETADLVNSLSREQLRKEFGISRVADITGLDNIGLPVYTTVRPLSETLSMHSGKGADKPAARAGAILEAIEYAVALAPKGEFLLHRALEIPADDRLAIEDCFPVRSAVVNDLTPLAWESMTNIQNGAPKLIPSDLIWMAGRIKNQPLQHFQSSSNGIASGGTLEDAILSGLYEVIERDAWSISQYLNDNFGISPMRSPLVSLPDKVEECVRRIEAAKCKLYLFDITTDYQVPVFNALILDLSGDVAGTFCGYGCHLDAATAAWRAINEAAQSRVIYISGARDDLFRRQYILMKRMDQHKLDKMFSELPATNSLASYRKVEFSDVKSELRYLLKFIRQFGISEVYVKPLGAVMDNAIHVVRVISPQCEPVRLDQWAPGHRCLSYCSRKLRELEQNTERIIEESDQELEDDPSERWKEA